MRLKYLATAFVLSVIGAPAAGARTAEIGSSDSLSVALGIIVGNDIKESIDQFASLGVIFDPDIFLSVIFDVVRSEPTGFTRESANEWINNYIRKSRPDELPDTYPIESQQKFLESVAATEGAVITPSGLVIITEKEGEGPMPTDSDRVSVTYIGKLYDGSIFDATVTPIEFGVKQVTAGFSEGLKHMKPGGTYRIVMPASLGYGTEGIPGVIPGNAALEFKVDLIEIISKY